MDSKKTRPYIASASEDIKREMASGARFFDGNTGEEIRDPEAVIDKIIFNETLTIKIGGKPPSLH
ncbi:MAG: hypothetical protein CVU77_04450 [Elusimicrobia bacterium HGW-Elusimicrobia-1]|jgi:hypothetical protein|nr:MAG: hypothetical protein CVU77_04450 [Elusimicrobia bacterium HGW-Elusimicrobia-1]